MKKTLYILFFSLLFISCSEFQKVLKQNEIKPKFDMANKLYQEGLKEQKNNKLVKALKLYEQIESGLQGKPQSEIVQYSIANALYKTGDYLKAGYKFERFTKSYPSSQKLEEAIFKSADSYYRESPKYSLDQADTEKAIDKLQVYLDQFPDGIFFEEANNNLQELRLKLEKKYYEIAKQYHHTSRFKAAISEFDNYLLRYPGSAYKEKAYYYKFESDYLLAINSFEYLVQGRLEEAYSYFLDYKERYPEGEFIKQAQVYADDINLRLSNLQNKKITNPN